jgi:hypothetical protein
VIGGKGGGGSLSPDGLCSSGLATPESWDLKCGERGSYSRGSAVSREAFSVFGQKVSLLSVANLSTRRPRSSGLSLERTGHRIWPMTAWSEWR